MVSGEWVGLGAGDDDRDGCVVSDFDDVAIATACGDGAADLVVSAVDLWEGSDLTCSADGVDVDIDI